MNEEILELAVSGLEPDQAARAFGILAAAFVTQGQRSPESLVDLADRFAQYVIEGTATWPEAVGLSEPPVKRADPDRSREHFETRRRERHEGKVAEAAALGGSER